MPTLQLMPMQLRKQHKCKKDSFYGIIYRRLLFITCSVLG